MLKKWGFGLESRSDFLLANVNCCKSSSESAIIGCRYRKTNTRRIVLQKWFYVLRKVIKTLGNALSIVDLRSLDTHTYWYIFDQHIRDDSEIHPELRRWKYE